MIKLTPISLFIAQLTSHLAAVYWFTAYFNWPDFGLVWFVYFLTGCLGVTCVYHRLLTHRSYQCTSWFEHAGTLFATLGLVGSSLSWTASHRLHHAKADKIGDPHSPKVLGFVRAQWLSMFSPTDIRRSPVLGSRFHLWCHKNYWTINLSYTVFLYFLGGFNCVMIFHLVPAAILWNAGSLVNTVCHTRWLGSRPNKTNDNSVNNFVLGPIVWGEGWHNNHHADQRDWRIGRCWWQIDAGSIIIKMVKNNEKSKLGLTTLPSRSKVGK
jgi:fatty-acid desaturase